MLRLDLDIEAEPMRQRRVDEQEAAGFVDRVEADRRVLDQVGELLVVGADVFLDLALGRDDLDAPGHMVAEPGQPVGEHRQDLALALGIEDGDVAMRLAPLAQRMLDALDRGAGGGVERAPLQDDVQRQRLVAEQAAEGDVGELDGAGCGPPPGGPGGSRSGWLPAGRRYNGGATRSAPAPRPAPRSRPAGRSPKTRSYPGIPFPRRNRPNHVWRNACSAKAAHEQRPPSPTRSIITVSGHAFTSSYRRRRFSLKI